MALFGDPQNFWHLGPLSRSDTNYYILLNRDIPRRGKHHSCKQKTSVYIFSTSEVHCEETHRNKNVRERPRLATRGRRVRPRRRNPVGRSPEAGCGMSCPVPDLSFRLKLFCGSILYPSFPFSSRNGVDKALPFPNSCKIRYGK